MYSIALYTHYSTHCTSNESIGHHQQQRTFWAGFDCALHLVKILKVNEAFISSQSLSRTPNAGVWGAARGMSYRKTDGVDVHGCSFRWRNNRELKGEILKMSKIDARRRLVYCHQKWLARKLSQDSPPVACNKNFIWSFLIDIFGHILRDCPAKLKTYETL